LTGRRRLAQVAAGKEELRCRRQCFVFKHETSGGNLMTPRKRTCLLAAVAAAAVLLGLASTPAVEAQERKSIRWTTTQVGSYG
jgi:hypothetical protein